MKVTDYLNQDEILAALAEEAAELAQAALKYRRTLTRYSPTPMSQTDALWNLQEEIADVEVCLNQLPINWDAVGDIHDRKLTRWIERLRNRRQ